MTSSSERPDTETWRDVPMTWRSTSDQTMMMMCDFRNGGGIFFWCVGYTAVASFVGETP